MPTAYSLRKYSSIHNMYVYLLQHCIIDFFYSSLQYLPCYMMSEVDHLSVFLSQFAQNMPHRYFLL